MALTSLLASEARSRSIHTLKDQSLIVLPMGLIFSTNEKKKKKKPPKKKKILQT
jgi:hypothetical protein